MFHFNVSSHLFFIHKHFGTLRTSKRLFITMNTKNVSFPHEAIRGLGFFSAQVDAFPHHEWPKATSDDEMHQRVLRKSLTRELPHVEKAFSN